jgi:osmotically-inducible protein OsmY
VRNDNDHFAGTATADLKTVAQDMLRMGKHWAQAAQGWLDQRREDMAWREYQGGAGRDAQEPRASGFRGVGPRNYSRSDDRIREEINERLTEADDLDASGLTVEVASGIATLAGTVARRWMKHRAEDIADGCSGVRDVHNHIQVAGAGSTARTPAAASNQAAHGTDQSKSH